MRDGRLVGDQTKFRPRAIDKARKKGAEVINISYGFGGGENGRLKAECDAILRAYRQGIVVVTSYRQKSPNKDQSNYYYPGRCGRTLATTATTSQGQRANDPERFQTFLDDYVDVAAPGRLIATVDASEDFRYYKKEGDYEGRRIGTSFAAPHVAGVANLLASRGVSNAVAYDAITHSGTPMGDCPAPCGGKLHAFRAVKSAPYNGVFEEWSTVPAGWSRNNKCGSGSLIKADENDGSDVNATPGGRYGLHVHCGGGGYYDLWQVRWVTENWHHRLRFAARLEGGASADQVEAHIYYLDEDGKVIGSTRFQGARGRGRGLLEDLLSAAQGPQGQPQGGGEAADPKRRRG